MQRRWVVAAGDAVALLAFALVGLASHDRRIDLHGLIRDALPILLGWFVAAAIFGVYRRPGRTTFLLTWATGITGGVLVRGLVLDRHVLGASYLTFLAVTLAVTLVFLLVWRGVFVLTRSVTVRTIAAPPGQGATDDRLHPDPDRRRTAGRRER